MVVWLRPTVRQQLTAVAESSEAVSTVHGTLLIMERRDGLTVTSKARVTMIRVRAPSQGSSKPNLQLTLGTV